jgi:CBS domain-containing protein
MLAKDIMRKSFVTVSLRMNLKEAMAMFLKRKITGAPVVDLKGNLVGVVSQTDIVRRDSKAAAKESISAYHREDEPADGAAARIEEPDSTTVADVMTPAVLSADVRTPIKDVAQFMLNKRIHRMVITSAGRPVGLITAMDMLRAVIKLGG